MKLGIRQGMLSVVVFAMVLAGLVSVDARVRDTFNDFIGGSGNVSPLGERAGDLGSALVSAVKYQSIDNAPMLVFAAVGALLVVFMLGSSKNFKR